MPGLLKWIAIGIAGLALLAALALVVVYFVAEERLDRTYDIPPVTISLPTDAASLERGRRLVAAVRCTECHAEDLGGQIIDDNPAIARFVATNLTSGEGGIGGQFSDADWERALRHGVGPDGQSLIITPAQYYYYLSDADVGAMISYIKSVPPVDKELPPNTLGPLARLILLLPFTDWLPAEQIDHTGPRPPAPQPGVTAAYGKYMVQIGNCESCHGSRGYEVDRWSETAFIVAMRSGDTPDGYELDNESMPWQNIGQMTDDELKAIWLYLQLLPGQDTGN